MTHSGCGEPQRRDSDGTGRGRTRRLWPPPHRPLAGPPPPWLRQERKQTATVGDHRPRFSSENVQHYACNYDAREEACAHEGPHPKEVSAGQHRPVLLVSVAMLSRFA